MTKRTNFDTAVADLAHAMGLLLRRMRAAAAGHDLSFAEASVMARLAKQGPAAIADLARAESVRPQSMGATIATLEEMEFVVKRPHPTDGRQVNIELTAKGTAARNSSKDAKRAWLAQAIAQLDKQEQEALFRAGEIVSRLAEM